MQKIQKTLLIEAQQYANRFVNALNESITHFHAVNHCKEQLFVNGFTELKEMYSL